MTPEKMLEILKKHADKNCKTCFGRGYIGHHIFRKNGKEEREAIPCRCAVENSSAAARRHAAAENEFRQERREQARTEGKHVDLKKIYEINRQRGRVFVSVLMPHHGSIHTLKKHDPMNRYPDEFTYGKGGLGSSALASSLLKDAMGCTCHHQFFMWSVIARWSGDYIETDDLTIAEQMQPLYRAKGHVCEKRHGA